MQKIRLANPRGFCAGVDRAIGVVEKALEAFGAPIYVRHEVVHNRRVVDELRDKGAVFVEELEDVPAEATVIFSAHGVSLAVRREAEARGLRVFDATCPLVTKVHIEVQRYAREGREVILIGHAGHPEVEGTIGQYEREGGRGTIHLVESAEGVADLQVQDPENLAYVSQTTLSMDDTAGVIEALRDRFPSIRGPHRDDICYATQNRQDAVREMADQVDVMIVVGSGNSSNTKRLKEISERLGIAAYQIDTADELQREWVADKPVVGVTSGASAPEVLVQGVVDRLVEWGARRPQQDGSHTEDIVFSLPRDLLRSLARKAG